MKTLKTHNIFLLILGLLGLLGGISRYMAGPGTEGANVYETQLQKGKNLALNICGQCHYDESSGRFIGKEMKDLPGFLGKIHASNLTHSARYGVIDKYSDAQLINLLKTGTGKDGSYIPWMIRPNLADTDLHSLIVYFRSNDSALIATDKVSGVTRETVAGKVAKKASGKPLPYKRGVKAPNENDSIAYGRYLADNLACYHCHSKSIVGLDYLEPEKSKGYMQGGLKMKTPAGKKIIAPNITADPEHGIGKLSQAEFRRAVQKGIMPNGDLLSLPMQRFRHLTDKQANAIYAYLFSLPLKHKGTAKK